WKACEQRAVVVDGSGAGEQETFLVWVGLFKRNGVQVFEPIEDSASNLLVVGDVAGVVEESHRPVASEGLDPSRDTLQYAEVRSWARTNDHSPDSTGKPHPDVLARCVPVHEPTRRPPFAEFATEVSEPPSESLGRFVAEEEASDTAFIVQDFYPCSHCLA